MIRTIDIRLNAAHPELPLPEATTYQGAPSTAFLRGVPKSCGLWQITAVSVAVTFPDGSTTTRAAVLSAGDVWVATIPACATSGRVVSGLRIMADGTDENGDAVTGFVLGVADFAVATFDIAPAPGATSYALRYFDNVPNPPHKGDVAKIANVLKYYDGTAWQVFADVDLSNYATKADATLTARYSQTPAFGAWTFAGFPAGMTDATLEYNTGADHWEFSATLTDETYGARVIYESLLDETDPDATSMEISAFDGPSGETISGTATRERTDIIGYILGSQTTKPVASEAEAEALRTGKQDALSTQQLANIAAVPSKANDADVVHKTGNETIAGTKTFSNGSLNVSDSNGQLLIMSKGFLWSTTGGLEPEILLPTTGGILALASQLPASETWTFEVDDGQGGTTTVTKSVAVYAAGGNS